MTAMIEEMIEYRRQAALIDQQRLLDSHVTVIGSGPLANFTLCLLAGLGVGGIKILAQDTVAGFEVGEFLIKQKDLGRQKAKCLEEMLSAINPRMGVKGRSIGPDIAFLGKPNIIVEATNDQQSKRAAGTLLASFKDRFGGCKKFISVSSDENSCHVAVFGQGHRRTEGMDAKIEHRRRTSHLTQERYHGKRQGILTSCIGASIVVDEIRKTLHPLEQDRPLETEVTFDTMMLDYYLGTLPPYQGRSGQGRQSRMQHPRRALLVGAGGIGTYVALNLALVGIEELHIYDPDIIEPHNLNRQLLYYGKIGEKKATTLAERISGMNPRIRAHAYNITFGEEHAGLLQQKPFDAVFSCVDSFASRKLLSNAAVQSRTPLIDGSVSTFDAFVDVYLPGVTPCLDCRKDYASLMAQSSRPQSCAEQEANTVMPNAMAAAMMVAAGLHILNGDINKPFTTRRFIHASQRVDAHKFVWAPFMTERNPAACGCFGGT